MESPDAAEYVKNGRSFKDFQKAWHDHVLSKKPPQSSMYWDGQFDEIPFLEWEDAGGCFPQTPSNL